MARGETVNPGTQAREAQFRPKEQVWIGRSRGSMREGTVVGYLGEGSYRVFIAEVGVRTVDEGLLSLCQEGVGAQGRVLEDLSEEDLSEEGGWQKTGTEKRSSIGQRRMRWYNPKLEDFEWTEMPTRDEEALSLLDGYPGAEGHVAVYREWRELGATMTAALIRAGEAAKEKVEIARP